MRRAALAGAGALAVAGAAWWWWRRAQAVPDGLEEIRVTTPRKPLPTDTGLAGTIGQGVNNTAAAVAAAGNGLVAGVGEVARAVADVFTPRGIRNHNPGNIRRTGDVWQGQAVPQGDASFIQFIAPEYGIRALARVLTNYRARGLRSVRQIIGTWAPPNENDTGSYVATVARALGVHPDAALDFGIHLPGLVAAIIRHENGQQPYTAAQIEAGIRMASA